jgi:hypothetical protein
MDQMDNDKREPTNVIPLRPPRMTYGLAVELQKAAKREKDRLEAGDRLDFLERYFEEDRQLWAADLIHNVDDELTLVLHLAGWKIVWPPVQGRRSRRA